MHYVLFMAIVAVSFIIEGLVGFGGNLIALPLANIYLPMRVAVPALTIVSLVIAIVRVCQKWRAISRPDYLKIMCGMLIGLPVGMLLLGYLPEKTLKMFLGIAMIIVGIKGLYEIFRGVQKDEAPKRKWPLLLALLLGGILQGAFACGGPFVVIYATAILKDKDSFTATLFAIWLTTNSLITVKDFCVGNLTPEVLLLVLVSLPAIAVALTISGWISKRLDGEKFSSVVYGILIVAGFLMA